MIKFTVDYIKWLRVCWALKKKYPHYMRFNEIEKMMGDFNSTRRYLQYYTDRDDLRYRNPDPSDFELAQYSFSHKGLDRFILKNFTVWFIEHILVPIFISVIISYVIISLRLK